MKTVAILVAIALAAGGAAQAAPKQSPDLSDQFASALVTNATVQVQQALKRRGFDVGPVDGIWGPTTAEAIRMFQKENGLRVSGRLDPETVAELGLARGVASTTDAGPSTTGEARQRK